MSWHFSHVPQGARQESHTGICTGRGQRPGQLPKLTWAR